MEQFAFWFLPAWFAIGFLTVAFAFLVTPRGERPDLIEFAQVALVAMICWPMLIWAFFHDGDQ